MIGAIVGDIAGSRFEWDNIKTKDFELFDDAKTPVIVERIVDEIDGIVRIVRFPGWQDTETGRREVSMELYGIFARKKLFDKDLVEKAYKYVEQYY